MLPIVGFFFGIAVTKEEAIKQNTAEWVIDEKTGERFFRWKKLNEVMGDK
jgi:hypothetical protein